MNLLKFLGPSKILFSRISSYSLWTACAKNAAVAKLTFEALFLNALHQPPSGFEWVPLGKDTLMTTKPRRGLYRPFLEANNPSKPSLNWERVRSLREYVCSSYVRRPIEQNTGLTAKSNSCEVHRGQNRHDLIYSLRSWPRDLSVLCYKIMATSVPPTSNNTTCSWLLEQAVPSSSLVLASSSSEASSLSSSHSSASIPDISMPGNPAGLGMVGSEPTTPATSTLPPFSLPPYLQGPKESSNNANFQGKFLVNIYRCTFWNLCCATPQKLETVIFENHFNPTLIVGSTWIFFIVGGGQGK